MAKSNLQLLQEAIAKGDLPRAAELTEKIAKAGKPVKAKPKKAEKAPSKPAKPRKSKAALPVKAQPKKGTTGTSAASKAKRHDIDVSVLDPSQYLAPSRRPGDDYFGGRTFIGPDGKEHTYAKRISMEGTKFINKFDPNEYRPLPQKHAKLEKKLKTFKTVPRPGQRGAERNKAEKIPVRCTVCRDVVEVYPWEAETVDGESSFRCSKKSCVKAR